MAVDIPREASKLEAGEPVEAPAVTQMGSTFAERAAAAQKAAKAVQSDDVENKAVKKAAASKKSAKKD